MVESKALSLARIKGTFEKKGFTLGWEFCFYSGELKRGCLNCPCPISHAVGQKRRNGKSRFIGSLPPFATTGRRHFLKRKEGGGGEPSKQENSVYLKSSK